MIKILLVEDDELNRDMLTRRLEKKGFSIVCAVDGLDAVGKSLTENPDIILMDMSLPGIMGWEAAKRIKAEPGTSDIPIIGLSAHALQSERDRALENGCDDYDTKPVDLNRLLSKIEIYLAQA